MTDHDWLAEQFEPHRPRLVGVARRILGTTSDVEDAVQEAWLRLTRSDPDTIDNIGGWLTTVVARVCLDSLRARARASSVNTASLDTHADLIDLGHDPARVAELADSVSSALLVVLDSLNPTERVAFVLHDSFAVPFDEIAIIVERSPAAVKQLASRARRKVQGHTSDTTAPATVTLGAEHRRLVDAFLAASRSGDLAALVAVLHPNISLHADTAGVAMGAPNDVVGAHDVAAVFSGRALGTQPAQIDELIGIVWIVGEHAKAAWEFTIEDNQITRIDMIADPGALASARITALT